MTKHVFFINLALIDVYIEVRKQGYKGKKFLEVVRDRSDIDMWLGRLHLVISKK